MKIITTILLLINFGFVQSQNLNFPGASPSLSFTDAINSKLDVNILATSKARIIEKTIKEKTYSPEVLEIYTQALLSYKINRHWSISGGYGFQRNNPFLSNWRNEHRLVQQASYFVYINHSMLYNRLRLEERCFSFPNLPNEFALRARYQIGFATPLSKSIYWQINEEAYIIPSQYRSAFFSENWLYSGFGFRTKYAGNFETGIGYNSVAINSKGYFTNYLLLQVAWSYIIKSHDKNIMAPVIHSRNF